ncbi:hypothetical protein CSA56_00300 [candidate division KSB3 bacterium]|uniref:Transmembrane protein n=1 Tax=candidate division KSB3 bacterium TaxID=2044937 RepID=A0A2G6KLF4_9BACT|nr:MAG: hypothetical protein CSA56_00300 [candidate division KSB3 bacterium]
MESLNRQVECRSRLALKHVERERSTDGRSPFTGLLVMIFMVPAIHHIYSTWPRSFSLDKKKTWAVRIAGEKIVAARRDTANVPAERHH